MDETQFDTLIKRLGSTRITRLHALRGLAVGAVAGRTGLRLFAEADAAKKNTKPRKRRVCLCTATGCTAKKVKNRSKVIRKNTPCAYAGGCTTNPCAATVPPPLGPPPPGCIPEPQSTTCAGNTLCGTTRTNNCGQVVTCSCRSGQTCLSNGSCAFPCELGGAQCAGCAGEVDCSGATTDGQKVCVRLAVCPPVPDCASTASCPLSFVCVSGCGCSRLAVCP